MSAANRIELGLRAEGERVRLLSPEVGLFTCALPKGRILVAGEEAGEIRTLGVSRTLVVPDGVRGRVASDPPRLVKSPVDVGAVLYELEAVGEDAAVADAGAGESSVSDLVLRAPHAGRFWHRPAPGEPPFASVGDAVEEGQPVGLMEVMKTFNHVPYRATGGLPARAKLARYLVDDGAEAEEGQPLLEVERA